MRIIGSVMLYGILCNHGYFPMYCLMHISCNNYRVGVSCRHAGLFLLTGSLDQSLKNHCAGLHEREGQLRTG